MTSWAKPANGAIGVKNEWLVAEVLHGDHLFHAQAMPFIKADDEPLAKDGLDAKIRFARGPDG